MKAAGFVLSGMLMFLGSLSASASTFLPKALGSGFSPLGNGRYDLGLPIPIICGLPASKNPVAGTWRDHERLRKEAMEHWSRIQGQKSSTTRPKDESLVTNTVAPDLSPEFRPFQN